MTRTLERFARADDMRDYSRRQRAQGKTIGFVPTMVRLRFVSFANAAAADAQRRSAPDRVAARDRPRAASGGAWGRAWGRVWTGGDAATGAGGRAGVAGRRTGTTHRWTREGERPRGYLALVVARASPLCPVLFLFVFLSLSPSPSRSPFPSSPPSPSSSPSLSLSLPSPLRCCLWPSSAAPLRTRARRHRCSFRHPLCFPSYPPLSSAGLFARGAPLADRARPRDV